MDMPGVGFEYLHNQEWPNAARINFLLVDLQLNFIPMIGDAEGKSMLMAESDKKIISRISTLRFSRGERFCVKSMASEDFIFGAMDAAASLAVLD